MYLSSATVCNVPRNKLPSSYWPALNQTLIKYILFTVQCSFLIEPVGNNWMYYCTPLLNKIRILHFIGFKKIVQFISCIKLISVYSRYNGCTTSQINYISKIVA